MEEYRRRTNAGELTYKPRHLDDRAEDLLIPSREAGRSIHCRVFTPLSGEAKGILLSRSTLAKIEVGHRCLTDIELLTLAGVLQVKVQELFPGHLKSF